MRLYNSREEVVVLVCMGHGVHQQTVHGKVERRYPENFQEPVAATEQDNKHHTLQHMTISEPRCRCLYGNLGCYEVVRMNGVSDIFGIQCIHHLLLSRECHAAVMNQVLSVELNQLQSEGHGCRGWERESKELCYIVLRDIDPGEFPVVQAETAGIAIWKERISFTGSLAARL